MNIKFFKYTHKIVVTDTLVHDVTISHCTDHNIHVATVLYCYSLWTTPTYSLLLYYVQSFLYNSFIYDLIFLVGFKLKKQHSTKEIRFCKILIQFVHKANIIHINVLYTFCLIITYTTFDLECSHLDVT